MSMESRERKRWNEVLASSYQTAQNGRSGAETTRGKDGERKAGVKIPILTQTA